MKSKTIIIDLATIYPGKGGAGGGIWSYAKNLLEGIDAALEQKEEMRFICMVNKYSNLPLRNVQTKLVHFNLQNFMLRFIYVHFGLPLYVFLKKATLHKVYFEVPFWTPFTTLVTIHDLMGDFYKCREYGSLSVSQWFKSVYFNWINKLAISKSNLIVVPSDFVKSELVNRYAISQDKVFVTPLATSSFECSKQIDTVMERAIRIYCVAAFHPHKGQLRVINVFKELCNQYNVDVELFFRGHVHDTSYFEKVQKKIRESNFQDRIHIVKYDPKSGLQHIYKNADWLILLSEYEGFGLPVIEAQANGVPVICSDIGTFREVAGDTAFYIEEHLDEKAAARKLYALLVDREQRRSLIKKGQDNVSYYNWERFTGQMMEVYRSLN